MIKNYSKLVNACLPAELIKALVEKTGLEKKNVEYICFEIASKLFNDGSEINKDIVLEKLKTLASETEIKTLLERLRKKYNINTSDSSKVLEKLIPLLFKRIATLNDSYFVAASNKKEKNKTKKNNGLSIDEVYSNIEKNVGTKKEELEVTRKISRKELYDNNESNENEFYEDDNRLLVIEKVCVIAVGVVLLALVAVIIILFIR